MSPMRILSTALLLAAPLFAQYSYPTTASSASKSPSTTTSVASTRTTIPVQVGEGGLNFDSNAIYASLGTIIEFAFHPRNHSVVRSSFDNPCVPLDESAGGFNSGFMPVASNSEIKRWAIEVRDMKPIWYYCAQGNHCGSKMVGVINPPAQSTTKNIETFKALAAGKKTTVPTFVTPDVVSSHMSGVDPNQGGNSSSSGVKTVTGSTMTSSTTSGSTSSTATSSSSSSSVATPTGAAAATRIPVLLGQIALGAVGLAALV